MKYPYRFKTKEEFIKEFGKSWNNIVRFTWASPQMDFLLGAEYPYTLDDINIYGDEPMIHGRLKTFHISWDMLIENKPTVPNYKPRKLREI